MSWSIHIARHDDRGVPEREFVGTFGPTDLPPALAHAMRRAADVGAGVQVRKDRATEPLLLR